jgi:hypothetical protein
MELTKLKTIFEAGINRRFYVKSGMAESEMKAVALSIYLDISNYFENFQANFVFSIVTESGYSCEDFLSNLTGFDRAVEPGKNYVTLCEPVSYDEALYV